MLHYPNLTRIEALTVISCERLLPVEGQVLARVGDRVDPNDVVARAEVPGPLRALNVAEALQVKPEELPKALVKGEGCVVAQGEVIAEKRAAVSFFQVSCRSPVAGRIADVADGRVMILQEAKPLELRAYLKGSIANVVPRYGVVVETTASLVQGIWGTGGETYGAVKVLAGSPSARVGADDIDASATAAVIVAGASVDEAGLRRAEEVGARGIVVGSLDYEVGKVAESLKLSVVITEGFGMIPMCPMAFQIFQSTEGREAMMDGSMSPPLEGRRPEVIIPTYQPGREAAEPPPQTKELAKGERVRVVRAPHMGRVGTVANLPDSSRIVETGERLWGAEVKFDDGTLAFVPFANLERIG